MSEAAALLALAAFAALVAICGEWGPKSGRRRSQNRPAPHAVNHRIFTPSPLAWDASEQLRLVMGAPFHARPVLSRAELPVFFAAQKAVAELGLPWCVLAQVSLGEVLGSADEAAFRAINSKRVDVLLMAEDGQPIAAIEYQGAGHYQSNAAARDAVKKEALRKAGIAYIEMRQGHRPADLAREIARIAAGRQSNSRGHRPMGCAPGELPAKPVERLALQPLPTEPAAPAEVRMLADAFRAAAGALQDAGSAADVRSSAPYRLIAIHAVELYLTALLRDGGLDERGARALGHDLAKRAKAAEAHGLTLRQRTRDHLATVVSQREYLVTRYGPFERVKLSELNRLEATLDEVAVKTIAILDRGESKGLAA